MLKGMAVDDPGFAKGFFDVLQGSALELAVPPDDPVRDRIALARKLRNAWDFVGDFVSILPDEGTLSRGNVPVPRKFKVVAIFPLRPG
jgi:hypothetical protein